MIHRRSIGLAALYLAISASFCAPLFSIPNGPGIMDWDQHLVYYAAVFRSLYEYAQPPFWNPWYCGGNVLWQNPQVALLSPVYPMATLVSLPLAMKLNIVLHYAIGFAGMHLLLVRALGVRFLPGTVFISAIFVLAGGQAIHLAVGHSIFLPVFYAPLQLFFVLSAFETRTLRPVVIAAVLMALAIYNGGLYVAELTGVGLACLGVVASLGRRDWRPVVCVLLVGWMGLLFAAPKLVPVAYYVTSDRFDDSRPATQHPDRMTLPMLARSYLDPSPVRGFAFAEQRHPWHEYGNHIGYVAALLLAAGIGWMFVAPAGARTVVGVALAVTSLFLFLMSAGEFATLAPYSISSHLPVLSRFRVPSRYGLVFVLFAAATAGGALAAAVRDVTITRAARRFAVIVCVLATAQLAYRNRDFLVGAFPFPPVEQRFHLLSRPGTIVEDTATDPYKPDSPMFRAVMTDRAVINCYEPLQVKRTYAAGRPLVFSSDASAVISNIRFSPNRITFSAVPGRESSKVTLNQNAMRGWRSDIGPVTDGSVLLAPDRAGRFAFYYRPQGLLLGVALLGVAIAVSAVMWRRRL